MDITIKGIDIDEKEVLEWVSVLVERKENQKLSPPIEAVEASKTLIDNFRKANTLAPKFEVKQDEQVGTN